MYKIGDTVIHKRDICKVVELVKNYRDDQDFYKLQVLDDSGVVIYMPADKAPQYLRRPLTCKEAKALIEDIPNIATVEISNFKAAQEYKDLINSGSHANLIRVIKTSYDRCEKKLSDHKNANENDKIYFRLAERLLYDELAISLDMTHAEAREYVVARLLVQEEATAAL